MIAVDTNVLVYSHRRGSPYFARAYETVRALAVGSRPWGIPSPCLGEFLSVVTSPRVAADPTPVEVAVAQVEVWLSAPSAHALVERSGTWSVMSQLLISSRVTGPRVHDARIAAICLDQGVTELWTADRDFGRFPRLRTRNPLVGA